MQFIVFAEISQYTGEQLVQRQLQMCMPFIHMGLLHYERCRRNCFALSTFQHVSRTFPQP